MYELITFYNKYLNFICISTPRLFLYVHLHVETNNIDNLYFKH